MFYVVTIHRDKDVLITPAAEVTFFNDVLLMLGSKGSMKHTNEL